MIWVKDWTEDKEDPDVGTFNIIQIVQDAAKFIPVSKGLL